MNKNAFINAACALLGAGGRGFVKALAFVLLGAFCAPVFAEEGWWAHQLKYGDVIYKHQYEWLKKNSSTAEICLVYGGLFVQSDETGEESCHILFKVSDDDFCDKIPISHENKRLCVLNREQLKKFRIECLYQGKICPNALAIRFNRIDPPIECDITLPHSVRDKFDSVFADIRENGVLDYIKSKGGSRIDINACRVILATLDSAVISSDAAMGACRAAKEKCPEDPYCPYKDSDYESELRELEKYREPLAAFAEEAKKCIKDTENFLNPAAPSE